MMKTVTVQLVCGHWIGRRTATGLNWMREEGLQVGGEIGNGDTRWNLEVEN